MNYSEKTFEGKREYYLRDQELIIEGTVFLSSDYQLTLPLGEIEPSMERVRVRSKAFQSGMAMASLFFIGAYVLSKLFNLNALDSPIAFLYMLGFCGVLLMLVTYRKIEYVQFRNKAGIPVIAIAKAGKRKTEFEHFVGCLRNNIESRTKT